MTLGVDRIPYLATFVMRPVGARRHRVAGGSGRVVERLSPWLRIGGLAVLLVCGIGCGPEGRAVPSPGAAVASRGSGCNVELITSGSPAMPFTRLGTVGAHARQGFFSSASEQALYDELKNQACALGADAVIELVRTGNTRFEWSELDVSGTAIRYGK